MVDKKHDPYVHMIRESKTTRMFAFSWFSSASYTYYLDNS